jgi:hypothetical protein
MQLSKEERLDLNLHALRVNSLNLVRVNELIQEYMKEDTNDISLFLTAKQIIEVKNHNDKVLLTIRLMILNE